MPFEYEIVDGEKSEKPERKHNPNMKIITVNLPRFMIDQIKKIVSEYGLYPSRSELVRVAVREFLIKELDNMEKYKNPTSEFKKMPESIDMRTIRFIRSVSQD